MVQRPIGVVPSVRRSGWGCGSTGPQTYCSYTELPFIDRPIRFRDYFSDIGVGADLFVYTEQELAAGTIPLAATALRTGIDLLPSNPPIPGKYAIE